MSSDLFPWGDSGKYKLEELPDLPEIKTVLAEVGLLARLYKQRLTSHPSEFVKMAAQKEDIVFKSIWDLELHSKVGENQLSNVLKTPWESFAWSFSFKCSQASKHVLGSHCICKVLLGTMSGTM